MSRAAIVLQLISTETTTMAATIIIIKASISWMVSDGLYAIAKSQRVVSIAVELNLNKLRPADMDASHRQE